MLKEYVKNYNRVVVVSDHVTHDAADIIFTDIVDSMKSVHNNNQFQLHMFDEFTELFSYDVPRRVIYDELIKKVKPNDSFIIRCEFYNSKNDTSCVPIKVLYNSDLCIYMVRNILTIIKDRGQTPEKYLDGIDLHNVGKSYKLNKILKRIKA